MAREEAVGNCRSDSLLRFPEQYFDENSERGVCSIRNQRSYTKRALEDTQPDGEQLVPIFLVLEWPFDWNVDVIGLFRAKNGQFSTNL